MATTTDLTTGEAALPVMNQPYIGARRIVELDFDTYNGDDGDTFKVMDLKADTLIFVIIDVDTLEGATCTIEVTTNESSAQTILTGANCNSAARLYGDGSTGAGSAEPFYINEDCELVVETNNDSTDTACLTFRVLMFEMSDLPS